VESKWDSWHTGSRVGFFFPTSTLDVQLDHFLHHTPKLGIPVEMVQFETCWNRFLVVYHDFHWFSLFGVCSDSGIFGKKRLNACGFAWDFSGLVCSTDPVKVSKDAASLLVCTRKKIFFAWGMRVFCEWRHKWRAFRPPWPTLPGPRRQPLGQCFSTFLRHGLFSDQYKPSRTQDKLRLREWYKH